MGFQKLDPQNDQKYMRSMNCAALLALRFSTSSGPPRPLLKFDANSSPTMNFINKADPQPIWRRLIALTLPSTKPLTIPILFAGSLPLSSLRLSEFFCVYYCTKNGKKRTVRNRTELVPMPDFVGRHEVSGEPLHRSYIRPFQYSALAWIRTWYVPGHDANPVQQRLHSQSYAPPSDQTMVPWIDGFGAGD